MGTDGNKDKKGRGGEGHGGGGNPSSSSPAEFNWPYAGRVYVAIQSVGGPSRRAPPGLRRQLALRVDGHRGRLPRCTVAALPSDYNNANSLAVGNRVWTTPNL
jgi:hypothetical protein